MTGGEFEWGVARDTEPHVLHRGPMLETEAREWVREWEEMSENVNSRRGMFVVIRRAIGPWSKADD